MTDTPLGASFRDPDGFLFERDGVLLRRVETRAAQDYDALIESGLYDDLVRTGHLIPHEEIGDPTSEGAHRILRPERVAFVSHPYEWSFSQLRDAALTTLAVQRRALAHDMTLKDASAYNVQFHRGAPVFIDTLSFERYEEGAPWVGYRQFCQHFLAPLALMAYRDVRLGLLLRVHLDGIPLDLARDLLPARAWMNLHLLMHIRVHARYQVRHQDSTEKVRVRPIAKPALINLIGALEAAVRKLRWQDAGTTWGDYYEGDSYTEEAFEDKRAAVDAFIERAGPSAVWDLGANTGAMSRLASERGIQTVAFDIDPACVDRNYRRARADGDPNLLPLLIDLANPSPALGWAHEERDSLAARGPVSLVLALALLHHLAIGNNVPLERIAAWLAGSCERAVVEFVPKSDPKVQVLLANREDVFDTYDGEGFEAAFGRHFEVEEKRPVLGSDRTLYYLRRRSETTSRS